MTEPRRKELKNKIHEWERKFQSAHPEGLKPTKKDREDAGENVVAMFKEYKALKLRVAPSAQETTNSSSSTSTQTELVGGLGQVPLWERQQQMRRRRSQELGVLADVKERWPLYLFLVATFVPAARYIYFGTRKS